VVGEAASVKAASAKAASAKAASAKSLTRDESRQPHIERAGAACQFLT